ncbi:winged helix-turn-helix transcriptional regulator [Flavobacterium aquidurense]|uniref:winged helix-turn-helix transcriptional regulator n=1 Tax=Flavobacterium aquidurense TaxID=362413 RepID=UPI00371A5380
MIYLKSKVSIFASWNIALPVWIALSKYIVSEKFLFMLNNGGCPKTALSIKDALEAIEGRWKLLILFSLSEENKRFKQISREVTGITDKTLSKELKNLETNLLIKRTAFDTFPPTVEYSITEHGRSLEKVMDELHLWGLSHRKKIFD